MQRLIDINGVVKVFKSLSGLDTADDKCAAVCRSAASSIARILRQDIDLPAEMPRLCWAAGCLAYYRYELAEEVGGVSGFKAGDITIDCERGGSAAARVLYEQAIEDISDLLIARKFAFRGV